MEAHPGLMVCHPAEQDEEEELPLAATSQFVSNDQFSAWVDHPIIRAPEHPSGVLRSATAPGASTPTALQLPSSPTAHDLPNPQSPNDAAAFGPDSLSPSSIHLASKLAWSHRLAELALSDAVPQQVIAAAAAAALAGGSHGPMPTSQHSILSPTSAMQGLNLHYDLSVGPTMSPSAIQHQSHSMNPTGFTSTQLPHLNIGQPGSNVWVSEESLQQSPSHTTRLPDAFTHQAHELPSTSTTSTTTAGTTHRQARQKMQSGAGAAHTEVDRLQAQVQSLDAANQELRRKVTDLTAQLETAGQQQQKQADIEQSLKAAVAEAETRLRSREHQLQVAEHQVDALTGELAAVRAALNKEQAARQEALDEVTRWKGEQQHMVRTLDDTTRKMNQIGGEERRLQAELQQLRREYGSCTDALAKCKVELSEVRERLQEAQQEAQRHSFMAHRAEAGNDGLSSQVVTLRNRLAELETRNASLVDEVRSLRQDAARRQQQEGAQALRSMQQQAHGLRPAGRTTTEDMAHVASRRAVVQPPPASLAVVGTGRLAGPGQGATQSSYQGDDSLKARYDQDLAGHTLDHWGPHGMSKVDAQGMPGPSPSVRKAMTFMEDQPPHSGPGPNPWSPGNRQDLDLMGRSGVDARHSLAPGATNTTTSASGTAGSRFMTSRAPSGQVHLLTADYNRPSNTSFAYPGNSETAYSGGGAFETVGQDSYHTQPTYLTSQYSSDAAGYGGVYSGLEGGSLRNSWSQNLGRPEPDYPPAHHGGVSSPAAGDRVLQDPSRYKLPGGVHGSSWGQLPSDSRLASDAAMGGYQAVSGGSFSSRSPTGMAAAGFDAPPSTAGAGYDVGGKPALIPDPPKHVTGLDVPFGTERTLKDILKRSQAMEDALVNLCHEKSQLDAEYAKLPLHGGRNSKQRSRKAEVESRLETVQKEISTLRLALKKMHGK